MKNVIVLIAVMLACSACETSDAERASIQMERERDLYYFRDSRTNLCFAWGYTYGGNKAYASVPCSEAVLALTR